jgi:hypothetical protein
MIDGLYRWWKNFPTRFTWNTPFYVGVALQAGPEKPLGKSSW